MLISFPILACLEMFHFHYTMHFFCSVTCCGTSLRQVTVVPVLAARIQEFKVLLSYVQITMKF